MYEDYVKIGEPIRIIIDKNNRIEYSSIEEKIANSFEHIKAILWW